MPSTSGELAAVQTAELMATELEALLTRRGIIQGPVTVLEVCASGRAPARFISEGRSPLLVGLPVLRRARFRLCLPAHACLDSEKINEIAAVIDLVRPLRSAHWDGAIDEAEVELSDGYVLTVGSGTTHSLRERALCETPLVLVSVQLKDKADVLFAAGELRLLRHGADVELRNVAPARPVWHRSEPIPQGWLLTTVAPTRTLDLVCLSLARSDHASVQCESRGLGIQAIHYWAEWPGGLTIEFDRVVAPFELVQLKIAGAQPDALLLNPIVCSVQSFRGASLSSGSPALFNPIDGAPSMRVQLASSLPQPSERRPQGSWGELRLLLQRQFPWFDVELERGVVVGNTIAPEVWAWIIGNHADPTIGPFLLEGLGAVVENVSGLRCAIRTRNFSELSS